jgi:hypothetical protein
MEGLNARTPELGNELSEKLAANAAALSLWSDGDVLELGLVSDETGNRKTDDLARAGKGDYQSDAARKKLTGEHLDEGLTGPARCFAGAFGDYENAWQVRLHQAPNIECRR